MGSREQAISNFLSILRLNTIKTQIIAFALLATLIPSLATGWISYVHNRRFLNEKISQELQHLTSHAARETDLWLKERLYELRVFSTSYVVTENLERASALGGKRRDSTTKQRRLGDYLKSVRGKFVDYEELVVLEPGGQVVASSAERTGRLSLPEDWQVTTRTGKPILGKPLWDDAGKQWTLAIAVPVLAGQEEYLGVLAARLNFRQVGKMLQIYGRGDAGDLFLITEEGTVLSSSRFSSSELFEIRIPSRIASQLFSHETVPEDYRNDRGVTVVGTLKGIHQAGWGVVAELDHDKAYAQSFRLRNLTIALIVGLLLIVGFAAYILGLTIVRPLNRLITAASQVASGNLDVNVPVFGRGELGYMTEVFNDMVTRLRQGREGLGTMNRALRERNRELHELSITDSLTGLYNRKHLMEVLTKEVTRAERYQRPLTLLMIDVDHFKLYNDTCGHLAGDEVLRNIAGIFRASSRESDCVGRYGGEEFLIILPETLADDAGRIADRIRSRLAEQDFAAGSQTVKITISGGIATFPGNGRSPESLLKSADAALYQAKNRGRNRVVPAASEAEAA
ncbi:MAG: diguanylate cyclase [Nitrospirota bacterium]